MKSMSFKKKKERLLFSNLEAEADFFHPFADTGKFFFFLMPEKEEEKISRISFGAFSPSVFCILH